MRPVPPRRAHSASARPVSPHQRGEAQLRRQVIEEESFQVLTVDGLNWIDPYTGTVVPAPFGHHEPALAWLRQHRPWQKDGQPVALRPLAELRYLRWVHWLKVNLPDPAQSWLRQFLPDGRWLNPFTGQPVVGIVRDNGRITLDTMRQLAALLRDCPPAQTGKPLTREQLNARLRELVTVVKPATIQPVQPAQPAERGAGSGERGGAPELPKASTAEAEPTRTAADDGHGTGALIAPSNRPHGGNRHTPRSHRESSAHSHVRSTACKSTQPPTEPSVRVVSGYRILGTLGMGGMSTVYRAVQLSMEREVALKVLDQQGPPDPAYIERFLREARSVGRISHPNVVTCYDVGVHHGNRLYMALELVTGGDATQLADRHGGRLPERIALGILRDAARGLHAIDTAGLIHRDIKPANLFIAADGSAKLGDLGLVRDLSDGGSGKYRTLAGIAVGTPAFMSPEQAQGAKGLDIRSDIYALGASIFALLAGRTPYEADTAFDLANRIIGDPVPDIREVRPELSPITSATLAKAMAKDRAARQQTPLELLQAAEDAISLIFGTGPVSKAESGKQRATMLPSGLDKLRANGYRVAEVRGKGLIATIGLGGSVLCVAAASGALSGTQAKERLDIRLRQYLAALRAPPLAGQPEATPSSLCRALLVDGLSAAVAQVELTQKVLAIGCTPSARAALANSKDANLLTEVSSTPVSIPFPQGTLLVLAAGLTGKPFALWGNLVARCDQSAEAFAASLPLTAEGSTILVLGSDG